MTREEYLSRLKDLLFPLTSDEQANALQYYSDYFDEADDDEKVMAELGNPEDLARTIVEKFANAPAKKDDPDSADFDDGPGRVNDVSDAVFRSFPASQVRSLSLDFGAAEVVMISGDCFAVETRGIAEDGLRCSLSSDGTLEISNLRRLNLNFLSHDRKKRAVPRILVSVPHSTDLYKFTLRVGAGDFRTKDVSVRCQEGSIEVGAGALMMSELIGGRVNVRCGMGSLRLFGSVTGLSNIDCGMGSVVMTLRGSKDSYSYDVKVGLGDFRFNDVKKSGLCQVLDNQKKENHFSVNCGMGSVSITVQ